GDPSPVSEDGLNAVLEHARVALAQPGLDRRRGAEHERRTVDARQRDRVDPDRVHRFAQRRAQAGPDLSPDFHLVTVRGQPQPTPSRSIEKRLGEAGATGPPGRRIYQWPGAARAGFGGLRAKRGKKL